ncbi:SRPBCC domain-containing protein [Streptomyces sp. NPDC004542]|uniref:SRPBCC domain-containing protein n=1 Tax=Streptomyces sp. NPDC004542 TaxID=3154281 RepID=UPI0033B406E1
MEHEVFLPVPAERLREALADPACVARAIPGLQQDAGAEPVAGRLKVRIGSHSITYRGSLRVAPGQDGAYVVEGDATETRGTGSVTLVLALRLSETDDGTTVTVHGTATGDGRVAELPRDAVASAALRLLNRCVEALGAEPEPGPEPEPGAEPESGAQSAGEGTAAADSPVPPPVPDTEIPPPALAPAAEDGLDEGLGLEDDTGTEGFGEPEEPPAEAAHARRTMIGRSAEEVDHAPPRGRYAPVPAPQTVAVNSTLRWAAPAAALVLASAIVVGRALRRRR